MKYVNLFFHVYQPPVQEAEMLGRIVEESYGPLTRQFTQFSDLKFTLNINYSLVEQLHSDYAEIIEAIGNASALGNLEMTGSAAYHAILPLLEHGEVHRQVRRNSEEISRVLQREFKPEGVFPPEMAFSSLELCPIFRDLGFKWTITDDSMMGAWGIEVPNDRIYVDRGMAVFLRSNLWANKFANHNGQWKSGAQVVQELARDLEKWIGPEKEGYIIIALDGETFGHHHPELGEQFLVELFTAFRESRTLKLAHLSEMYHNPNFKRVQQFIPPGSWSIDQADIRNRDFFSWWKSPFNKVHKKQWEFTTIVLKAVRRLAEDDPLQLEMDRALFSCQYWWASFWKFQPGEIYRGAFNMMRLFQRAIQRGGDSDLLERGEAVFREFVIEVEEESANRKRKHG